FTSLKDGGFYGWPYSYIGDNVDSRVKQEHPELVKRAIIPDVLLGAHVAPLEFAFYSGKQFPESYWGGAFIAEHGSWNRAARTWCIGCRWLSDGKCFGYGLAWGLLVLLLLRPIFRKTGSLRREARAGYGSFLS